MLKRPLNLDSIQKIVIKVGTRLLTYETGKLNLNIIEKLAREIADLKNQGKDVVLVSSGAVGGGIGRLGLKRKPVSIQEKQAVAAIGQGYLIHFYEKIFSEYGHIVAQILMTREDLNDRKRYINSRNTFLHLLKFGAIPIVNENDTISTEEIEFGDNDKLSALVATLIDADLLIILTDIDALFTANPRLVPTASRISFVDVIDKKIKMFAGNTEDEMAKGGMITKVEAAEIVMASGIDMVIANGRHKNIIRRILSGEDIGTYFCSQQNHLRSRKRWIAFAQKVKGTIYIDQGAEQALKREGKSLLPIGITKIEGLFSKGETVSIHGSSGKEIARGLVNYDAEDLQQIIGINSAEINKILGYSGDEEVIHRDNLVLC
ncbi:MAG TPA: glutamate 5-kinase [Firmicutes bacterium]|nr:glutamate 5-kinase [Bacillota bacterium]